MQRFPCPFCGLRPETEFYFAGEAGKTRPDTTADVSDEDWARYLHSQRNDKGEVREVWMHLTCQELYLMHRDSATMQVLGSEPLRKVAK